MWPFDRSQILEPNCWKILKPIGAVCDCPRAVWVVACKICETNCIVMCMRPEMAIKIRVQKVKPILVIWP